MSRGGFRGRGRGGPPGISAFNSREYLEAMKKANKHGGMLYPPLESRQLAYLSEPSEFESTAMAFSADLQDVLARGSGGMGTPWRLASERKSVGIEIETYSDRKNPQNANGGAKAGGSTTTTSLDPAALYMDKSLFPPILWKEYFEGPGAGGKKGERGLGVQKKRKRLEDDDIDRELEEVSEEESVVDDFDFDDDEGSDHQDYDANYFDNGEGDDDSGGEEEEANNGGGDD